MRNAPALRWLATGLVAIVAFLEAHLVGSASAAERQKTVLALYSTRRDAQIAIVGDRELPRLLEAGLPEGVDFYSEYVDQTRFLDSRYLEAVAENLQLKFEGHRFDVVIAIDSFGIELVNRSGMFDGTPVIFFASSPEAPGIANSTGLLAHIDFAGTLALAMALQPDIRNVFFVSGVAGGEDEYERLAQAQLRSFEPRLSVSYLKGLPTSELEARLSALPEHSIVFYWSVSRDGAGENFHPLEYLDRIQAVSSAPIYSWVDSTMDHGVVGGSFKSQKMELEAIAKLALRVLKGERAENIPISSPDLSAKQVDWRQLRRWGISEARVPADVTVLFRQPTVFGQYKTYIISAITLIVLQTTLIGGLVMQRQRRRRAEQSLHDSEQHFRTMADTAPVMIWRTGTDKQCEFVNLPWLLFRGRTLEQEMGDGWADGVHPEDRDHCLNTYAEAFERREPFQMEYRVQRADGEYRWVLDTGVPRQLPDGTFSGYIGSCLDITERKNSEEALRASETKLRTSNTQIRDLASRLIRAQEEERSRIARELHDDIGQQLALLTMELALGRHARPEETHGLSHAALTRAQAIAGSLHDLSHRLHPARLRVLGLVDAVDALLRDLQRSEVAIRFAHVEVPPKLPLDLTVCLFRIVQEGLQNALKYSKAHEVSVHLSGSPDGLTLTISDDGVGFDPDAVRGSGLGLISMRERLEAFGGKLATRSTPGAGTTLRITVPLDVGHSSEMAAV